MSLVITRKLDEGFRLYDETGKYIGRVVVLAIKPNRISLGIDTDARFTVLRDELVDPAAGVHPVALDGSAKLVSYQGQGVGLDNNRGVSAGS